MVFPSPSGNSKEQPQAAANGFLRITSHETRITAFIALRFAGVRKSRTIGNRRPVARRPVTALLRAVAPGGAARERLERHT